MDEQDQKYNQKHTCEILKKRKKKEGTFFGGSIYSRVSRVKLYPSIDKSMYIYLF